MRLCHAFAAATVALVIGTPGVAHATGGGSNQGTIGVVYNSVTVGGVTLSGMCEYHVGASGLTITGQANAAAAAVATSMRCRAKHGSYWTDAVGSAPGNTVAVASSGNPPLPGTGVCITMSVTTLAAAAVSAPEFCV